MACRRNSCQRYVISGGVFLLLACAGAPGESLPDLYLSTAEFDKSDITLSESVPQQGDKIDVRAKIHNQGSKPASNIVVRFYQECKGRKRALGKRHRIAEIGTNNFVSLTQEWSVPANGFYKISAAIDPDNRIEETEEANNEASLDVPVTAKKLYIHYWHCPESTRYVTSVMTGGGKRDTEYWKGRGVIPVEWKPGYGYSNWTEEQFVTRWSSVNDGNQGIAIDEFGDTDAVGDRLAAALVKTREKCPNYCIIVWAAGLGGTSSIEAYKKAGVDYLIAETYCSFFGDYSYRFDGYWDAARKHGLTDQMVFALALYASRKYARITTEQELLRQVRYIKKLAPEMKGVAFFSNAPDHLFASADKAVYDYYIKPVVWVKKSIGLPGQSATEHTRNNTSSNIIASVRLIMADITERLRHYCYGSPRDRISVINVGGMDAENVRMDFFSGESEKGGAKVGSLLIKHLRVGQELRVAIPPEAVRAAVVPSPYYTVLN